MSANFKVGDRVEVYTVDSDWVTGLVVGHALSGTPKVARDDGVRGNGPNGEWYAYGGVRLAEPTLPTPGRCIRCGEPGNFDGASAATTCYRCFGSWIASADAPLRVSFPAWAAENPIAREAASDTDPAPAPMAASNNVATTGSWIAPPGEGVATLKELRELAAKPDDSADRYAAFCETVRGLAERLPPGIRLVTDTRGAAPGRVALFMCFAIADDGTELGTLTCPSDVDLTLGAGRSDSLGARVQGFREDVTGAWIQLAREADARGRL